MLFYFICRCLVDVILLLQLSGHFSTWCYNQPYNLVMGIISVFSVIFDELALESWFYLSGTTGEGEVNGRTDGFGGDVELVVIGKDMKL